MGLILRTRHVDIRIGSNWNYDIDNLSFAKSLQHIGKSNARNSICGYLICSFNNGSQTTYHELQNYMTVCNEIHQKYCMT